MLGVAVLAALVLFAVFDVRWEWDIDQGKTSTEEIGNTMFEDYHLAFLFIGFILFAAMLGGMFLAKDEETRDKLMRPTAKRQKKQGGDGPQ
jgi:NADH:ubiquinone oxidoreductase subunit 6 (subunit J)